MKENVSGCFFLNTVYIHKLFVEQSIRTMKLLSYNLESSKNKMPIEMSVLVTIDINFV